MTDYEDAVDPTELDEDEFDEITGQRKKKKKGEMDRQGREAVDVSEGFINYMSSIGASKSLIAEILRGWRHLRGEGLASALKSFAGRLSSRATAHVEVEIDKDKDFSLLHNIIQYFKSTSGAPTQRRTLEAQSKHDPK